MNAQTSPRVIACAATSIGRVGEETLWRYLIQFEDGDLFTRDLHGDAEPLNAEDWREWFVSKADCLWHRVA